MTIVLIVAVLTAASGCLAAVMAISTASVIHGSGAVRMCSPIWGRIVSRGRPRSPAIALTFDDGPTEPYTSQILDVLRAFDARATFFVLGVRAAAAPAALTRAVADGHEVGNHTWDHAALPLATPRVIRATIRRTSDLVERVTGVRPRVFRAPFGWRNPWVDRVARGEGCVDDWRARHRSPGCRGHRASGDRRAARRRDRVTARAEPRRSSRRQSGRRSASRHPS